jgi:uncharacterized protein (DUF486 family)
MQNILILILLLVISNTFMTLAWYGHLKYKASALWLAIAASWGLALFEYIFQVPANRIGSETLSVTQLKILQECITLVVFTVMAFFMFNERPTANSVISYILLSARCFSLFAGKQAKRTGKPARSASIR